MKRGLLVIVCVISANFMLISCGKNSTTPGEKRIKEDITNSYRDYVDTNVYFNVNTLDLAGGIIQERQPEVTSVKITKSKTSDDSYSAWCDVTFEDELYKDTCVIVVTYDKYDKNYWEIRTMYQEDGTKKAKVINAIPETIVKELISSMYKYDIGDYSYTAGEVIKSELDDNICYVDVSIENILPIQGKLREIAINDIIKGYDQRMSANVNLTFEFDGINKWDLNKFQADVPDRLKFIEESADALKKVARFYLNGDRNIDSLYIDPDHCWLDESQSGFTFGGDGGKIVLEGYYDFECLEFYIENVNAESWEYEYGGERTEGNMIFFNIDDYLRWHL